MSQLKVRFSPSPPWFTSKALDTSLQGHLAYIGRSSVFVFDIVNDVVFRDSFLAHDAKVTSLSFCKVKDRLLLCTSCETGTCKVWNLEEKPKAVHTCEPEQKKSAQVEWKFGCENVIFIAWAKCLKEWNLSKKHTSMFKCTFKDDIVILTSCAADPNLLAVGLKSGKIEIVDVLSTLTRHKLMGHSNELCSLSWHPTSPSRIVSAASDGMVRTWTVFEGKEAECNVYHQRTYRKADSSKNNRDWRCAIFHPLKENAIISATQSGDVTWWEDTGDKPDKISFKTDMGGHDRMLFVIIPFLYDDKKIVSFSLDRSMIIWDVEAQKSMYQVYVLAGGMLDLAFSPFDNANLAVACRDGSIRVWNTVSSLKNSVKIHGYGIKGAVQRIAWHPKREGLVAFSADEGRVGVLDTLNNRHPSYFSRVHGGYVYALSWGPCLALADPEQNEKQLYLYSCGKGKIFIHTMTSFSRDSADFEDLIQTSDSDASEKDSYSDISWKPDFSLLAVGTDAGEIKIFAGDDFALIATLSAFKRQIQCVQWHPEHVSVKSARCQRNCWLACGSNESDVVVFDIEPILGAYDGEAISVKEPFQQLKGHAGKISQLCWSPHVEGQLASASGDCTLQVWDVNTGKSVACFQTHEGRVFTVEWSYMDPDVIYSAGEDGLLFSWKVSEQTERTLKKDRSWRQRRADKKTEKKTTIKTADASEKPEVLDPKCEANVASEKTNSTTTQSGEIQNGISIEVQEVLKQSKEHDKVVEGLVGETPVEIKSIAASLTQPKRDHHSRRPKYFKQHTTAMISRKRTELIADTLLLAEEVVKGDAEKTEQTSDGTSEEKEDTEANHLLPYMGVFRSHDRFFKTFANDALTNREMASYSVWAGTIKNTIIEAAEKGELQDHLLTYAPLISRKFWMEMCEKYAKQLIFQRQFVKAVPYLLMCNKVYEAIDLLRDYCHPKDALILAKLRLPENDPRIVELLQQYATKLIAGGQLECAANCYISLKDPLKAAEVVARRQDALSSKLAADICQIFKCEEAAKSYTLECVQLGLLSNKWEVVEEALAAEASLFTFIPLIAIHKSLITELHAEDKGFGLTSELTNPERESHIIWKCHNENGIPYLQILYDSIPWQQFLNKDANFYENAFTEISFLLQNGASETSLAEIVYVIAANVMLFFCALNLTEGKEGCVHALKHINKAFSSATKAMELNFLNVISQLLFPCDLVWDMHQEEIKPFAENCGIIAPFSKLIVTSFSELNISSMLMSLSSVNEMFEPESRIRDFDELVEKTAEIDCVFSFFALNIADEVAKRIFKQKLVCAVEKSPKSPKVSHGSPNVKGSNQNGFVLDDGHVETSEASSSSAGGSSPSNTPVVSESSHTSRIVEDSHVSESGTVMSNNGFTSLLDKEVIREGSCEQVDVSSQNTKSKNGHQYCFDVSSPFLKLMDLSAALVCQDVFMVKAFLSKRKQKTESMLFEIRVKKKEVDVKPSENISEAGAGESGGQEVNASEKVEEKLNGDVALNGTTDLENHQDAETNEAAGVDSHSHSELDGLYKWETDVLDEFNKKTKDKHFPDHKLILHSVAKLCDRKLEAQIGCPQVRLVMFALSNQLDMWESKFSV